MDRHSRLRDDGRWLPRRRRSAGARAPLGFARYWPTWSSLQSFAALTGAAAVLGLGNGLSAGLIMTLGADLAPADRRGEFIGVFRMMPELGGVAGPVALGVLLDAASLFAGTVLCGGFGLAAALFMAACVKETLVKEESKNTDHADEAEESETEGLLPRK